MPHTGLGLNSVWRCTRCSLWLPCWNGHSFTYPNSSSLMDTPRRSHPVFLCCLFSCLFPMLLLRPLPPPPTVYLVNFKTQPGNHNLQYTLPDPSPLPLAVLDTSCLNEYICKTDQIELYNNTCHCGCDDFFLCPSVVLAHGRKLINMLFINTHTFYKHHIALLTALWSRQTTELIFHLNKSYKESYRKADFLCLEHLSYAK